MSTAPTGGMVVSRALARYGIRTVFALAGASHTHLLEALDRDGFRIVSGRHESGTVSAADGYARVSGRIGVALVIAEQGLPNAVNGIATAWHACSPVLVLVARLPDSWTEAEAEHDTARLALVAPICKWARTVPARARLAEYVDAACKRALAGRPGPVVLQFPQDWLAASHAGGALPPVPQRARPAAEPAAIERAAELLATARRPLVVTGAGATWGQAGPALRELAGRFGLPVAGNGLGRGVVPEDWRRAFAWPLMQSVAHEADVVCLVGARLKQRLGYGLPPRFGPAARFIQIDVEPEELARNRRIEVPIAADARAPEWIAAALQPRFEYLQRLEQAPGEHIHPLVLGRELAALLPEDAILVGDGADVQNWMYGALRVRRAPGFLEHYPLGAMGVGTPLAVGAAAAARELAERCGERARPVVLATGDGAFGFYPAELHAAALAGLPLRVVIGNDGAWGTELHGQLQSIGRAVNTTLGSVRYELIGAAFGCHAERVERREALRPALERALAAPGPAVLNVLIDPQAGAAVKREPLARMIMFDDLATQLRAQHAFDA